MTTMEWWDEDPELLSETLGLLASWQRSAAASDLVVDYNASSSRESDMCDGTDSIRSFSSSSSDNGPEWNTATPTTAPPPHTTSSQPIRVTKRARRRVNVSRERRKTDLQSLRNTVAELQDLLQRLQDRRATLLQPHYRDPAKHELASTAPIWENMATRQFQARRRSEMRNERLKKMLETQVQVAEDLLRMIRVAHEPIPDAMQLTRMPTERSSRMSHESQLARLSRLCAQWSDAWTLSPKFEPKGPLVFADMQIIEEDDDAMRIDIFTSHVLPYSIDRVEAAMWGMFVGGEDNGEETWDQHVVSSDDTLSIEFTTTSTVNASSSGMMSGKWIVKRFSSLDQASRLIVSHSFTDPTGFKNELDSSCVDDDAWVRLVDAHTLGHTHLPQPLTVVQHVRRTRIAFGQRGRVTASPLQAGRADALTKWLANDTHNDLEWA